MVGWIAIDGTSINYPVMQSRNNPNFYLKHSFEKEYSDLGVPYIQEDCDIPTSDNLVIYGHHIKGGRMFGALENYKSKSFYEKLATTTSLPFCAEYSQVERVMSLSPYSAVTPVSYKASSLHCHAEQEQPEFLSEAQL